MVRITRVIEAAVLLTVAAACQQAETLEQAEARIARESSMFREQVVGRSARWERWTAAGQADSIAAAFTEQGHMMQPNGPDLVGRDAIRANQQQLFAMGQWTIDVTPESVMSNGPIGVDRGRYTLAFARAASAPREAAMIPPADSGKYVVHWHHVNGDWKIVDLIWNSNLPVPVRR
jgi:ketosteroid isomerase-like protein